MIVKKMFGFLIDDKFVSHEELALEFEKLQGTIPAYTVVHYCTIISYVHTHSEP